MNCIVLYRCMIFLSMDEFESDTFTCAFYFFTPSRRDFQYKKYIIVYSLHILHVFVYIEYTRTLPHSYISFRFCIVWKVGNTGLVCVCVWWMCFSFFFGFVAYTSWADHTCSNSHFLICAEWTFIIEIKQNVFFVCICIACTCIIICTY